MKTIANTGIRETAKRNGVCLWQVAETIGISDASFSRKLRRELPDNERERILNVIEKLGEDSIEVK